MAAKEEIYYKAVKITNGVMHSARHGSNTVFKIGETLSLPGKPLLCAHGFHACKQPMVCFTPEYGYHIGPDVLLLTVVFVGDTDTDPKKTCGTTMTIKGLATVDVGPDVSFKDGLFYGVIRTATITKRFEGSVLHSPDVFTPAETIVGVGFDIFSSTVRKWYSHGLLHRENDLPALEVQDDHDNDLFLRREWHVHGKLHREGGLPALEYCGQQQWYRHGVLHRDDDLPAVVQRGLEEWHKDGLLHRENDRPAVIECGTKKWYVQGKLHRERGLPAIEDANGSKQWYRHGVLHRDGDLPAIENSFGNKKWYRDGCLYREMYDGQLWRIDAENPLIKIKIKTDTVTDTDTVRYRCLYSMVIPVVAYVCLKLSL